MPVLFPVVHELKLPAVKRTGERVELPCLVRTYNVAGKNINVAAISSLKPGVTRDIHAKLEELFPSPPSVDENPTTYFVLGGRESQKLRHIDFLGQGLMVPSRQLSRMYPALELVSKETKLPGADRPVVFDRLVHEKWCGEDTPLITPIFKSLLRIAASHLIKKGELLTHGTAAVIETPKGPKGLLILGPPGVGKTELMSDLLKHGAKLMGDDVVRLFLAKGGRPMVGGTNYAGFLRFKNALPEKVKRNPKDFFLQIPNVQRPIDWGHLPLTRFMGEELIGRKVLRLEDIFHPDPVPLDTLVFLVPYNLRQEEQVYNLKFKRDQNPSDLARLLANNEWNTITPLKRFTMINPIVDMHAEVATPTAGRLINLREDFKIRKRPTKAVIREYMTRVSTEEYGIDRSAINQSQLSLLLGKIRGLHVIGKWTPPEIGSFFTHKLIEAVKNGNGTEEMPEPPKPKLSKQKSRGKRLPTRWVIRKRTP